MNPKLISYTKSISRVISLMNLKIKENASLKWLSLIIFDFISGDTLYINLRWSMLFTIPTREVTTVLLLLLFSDGKMITPFALGSIRVLYSSLYVLKTLIFFSFESSYSKLIHTKFEKKNIYESYRQTFSFEAGVKRLRNILKKYNLIDL